MAINPEIMEVQRENHKNGAALIPMAFHGRQKLPDPAAESRAFFNAIFAKNARLNARGIDSADDGATFKKHVRAGGHRDAKGRVLPSRTFMIKPYYEALGSWDGAYGGYPLGGWAELATQALMHAGGLGHMAMRVHSHVPSSGSPVLAVEIEPGMHRVGSAHVNEGRYEEEKWFGEKQGWGRVIVPENIRGEAAKLAALDFLTNNQDRHGGNLLFRPDYQKGKPQVGDLLAIDHGRSFHYSTPNRFVGTSRNPGRDSLFSYLESPGYEIFELRKGKNNRTALSAIANWWQKHGKDIQQEFHKQLRGIKVRPFARHIENNFTKRAEALDKFVKTFNKKGHDAYRSTLPNKRAMGEVAVTVGGHDPSAEWEGGGRSGAGSYGLSGQDICPTCGDCLTCNPHTPGEKESIF